MTSDDKVKAVLAEIEEVNSRHQNEVGNLMSKLHSMAGNASSYWELCRITKACASGDSGAYYRAMIRSRESYLKAKGV